MSRRSASTLALFLTTFLAAPGAVRAASGCPEHGSHGLAVAPPSLEADFETAAGRGRAERGKAGAEEPKKEEPAKWDVEAPTGASGYDVDLDVREGTWLSLDLSPDGKELVFDLLGDLYLLPVEGGEARNLTTGVSWDMQPRFSPDGKTVAFTSDRAGGDNVWLIDRDGKNPRAVTKESFRLLNSPAWSPDGEYLVARKHFTAERSLGSGEIWLYHRSGGDGLQLTAKPNDQKDVGEPAFSPDGRYVYFSQDTTPGNFFQYNKDPNPGIYSIRRLDRETGEIEAVVSGFGGAVRPTPSPDGKSLAFVRRERGKTVLAVRDLDSGRVRNLFDGLERDMQETWAVHGVYPSMAWSKDGRTLYFWAAGKLHRIDVASGTVVGIPFHVKDKRRVFEAVRSPQEIAPGRFTTKMLRWVEVSPAGGQVLFQTLGQVYLRDLPEGPVRRLTAQGQHFEHYPSFSRDGRSVVYTSWSDSELSAVRLAPVAGGESKVLTAKPGHYVEPALSPDGRFVVFRRLEGDLLRSPFWSGEPGLYALPVAGGEEKLVSKGGFAPHFGAGSDRVFFLEIGDGNTRFLKSIALDGTEERTHVKSENATEMRVSPDGRWLAFVERFNAYVTPFILTGKTVDIGPTGTAVPLARVTKDAGENVHFAGDSSALHWSLGPELFTRKLTDAFAFLAGAPEKLPEPPTTGTTIGFEADADRPTGTIALVGGRVVTMKGDEVIEDGVVVVEGSRISAIGRRGALSVPAGATVIDVAGKTVLPGLIDAHWHGPQGSEEIIPQQSWVNLASLAFGVTTLHDPSNDTSEIFAAAELQKAGLVVAPRITSTGTILYGAKAPFKAVIESLDEARSHLKRLKAVGAFSVKSYNQPRRDQRQQVLTAARELGMLVVPEGGSLFQHNMTMVVDGHTGVEHTIPVAHVYADVHQLWSKTRVGYTPTLVVGYGGLWGEEYWYAKTNVWENGRLLTFVPREAVDPRSRRRTIAPDDEWNHFHIAEIAADLAKLGVGVNVGAHGQREGLAAHWEMWMLVQGGLTPHQALRAGTLSGARYLGLDKDLGSLEPGKLADLIVIDGNPLADIRVSEKVSHTMVGGRLYDAATMDEVAPRPKKRGKLWWEE